MSMQQKTLNILVAAPLYPPEIGGPATHVMLIEEELPKRGISLDVLAFAPFRKRPKIVRHIAYAVALYRRARSANLIYTLDPVSVGLPAYVASRFSGVPYVLRIGGDYAWEQGVQRFGIKETLDEYLARGGYSLPVRALAAIQAFVARRAATVIVPSRYLGTVAAAWGVPRERIAVAYSAPDPLHEVSREEARKALGVPESAFLIVSAARLMPWKGYARLIDAVALLRKERPDAILYIAGDGPERVALEAHVHKSGLVGAVRLIGRLPREALSGLLYAADCFALNTRYEGLSHQILEAFMAGTPVVTTNAGGNAEVIEDEVSGLVVPFNDTERIAEALMRLALDPALRERLREGARMRLGAFSTGVSMDAVAEALKGAAKHV